MNYSRRQFLGTTIAATIVGAAQRELAAQDSVATNFPPVRAITRGPKHHWFGYYDKLQFDPTGRYVLGMQVGFEHRSPRPDDVIRIGMVDLQDNDRWIELGTSTAWCWQQGCMLQWLPGSKSEVIWNDREKDRYVCHVLDVETRNRRTIPHAIYSVSPDGKSAVAPDFRRLGDVRPGYGYNGLADPHSNDPVPTDSGIFHIDLATGKSKLIISVADIVRTGELPGNQLGAKHYFNHLLYSPDGSRFIALHRWKTADNRRMTRLITAKSDGTDIRIVIPNGYASHFIWRDNSHILSQGKEWLGNNEWSNLLFADKDAGIVEGVGHGVLNFGGHLSYLPHRNEEWILNDTYPEGKERLQTPHLYHVPTKRRIDLGRFHSPASYKGEWRCDTHPRYSPDGRYVCIDSPHGGAGRQMYLIEIAALLK
ncbi:MAG: hypothetical protein SGJ20_19595 [Planctomycetota bacterium]|nr:hypothetical protein [Planctomycetota bacterium]